MKFHFFLIPFFIFFYLEGKSNTKKSLEITLEALEHALILENEEEVLRLLPQIKFPIRINSREFNTINRIIKFTESINRNQIIEKVVMFFFNKDKYFTLFSNRLEFYYILFRDSIVKDNVESLQLLLDRTLSKSLFSDIKIPWEFIYVDTLTYCFLLKKELLFKVIVREKIDFFKSNKDSLHLLYESKLVELVNSLLLDIPVSHFDINTSYNDDQLISIIKNMDDISDLFVRNKEGINFVMSMLQQKRTEVLRTLLDKKPDLELFLRPDHLGNTLLHVAAIVNDHDLIHYILNHTQPISWKIYNNKGETPLDILLAQKRSNATPENLQAIKAMLLSNYMNPNDKDDFGETDLMKAIYAGMEEIAIKMLERSNLNLNLNIQNEMDNQKTVLMRAAIKKFKSFLNMSLNNFQNFIDLSIRDEYGNTLLHFLANDLEMSDLIILLKDQKGFDLNAKNHHNMTPVMNLLNNTYPKGTSVALNLLDLQNIDFSISAGRET